MSATLTRQDTSLHRTCMNSELSKMAREICSAAWPLNSTWNPVIITSHNMSRQTDRHTERDRHEGIHWGPPLLFSLRVTSGLQYAVCKQGCEGMTMFPFSHMCLMPSSIPLDNQRAGGKTYVCVEITLPVIKGNKASLNRLTIWKTINEKSDQRMLRVGLSAATHNRSKEKGRCGDRDCWGSVLFNWWVPL